MREVVRPGHDDPLRRSAAEGAVAVPEPADLRVLDRSQAHLAVLRPTEVAMLVGVPKDEHAVVLRVSKKDYVLALVRCLKIASLAAILSRRDELDLQLIRLAATWGVADCECVDGKRK